ncbi:MAG TPA: response regulator transcription factor [Bacteroidia bacterium]|jgi:DNA-binding NarL/FixJ family response regulator|nr:response regulator transcription factor [Bacteroidia bacterium]
MYKLLVADSSVLMREGLKSLIKAIPSCEVIEVTESKMLSGLIKENRPEVLVIDPVSFEISHTNIASLKKEFKNLQILAITNPLSKEEISSYLNSGVTGFLLKDCDKNEICEAIESTRKGDRFLCGKIADILINNTQVKITAVSSKKLSCEGFVVSEREIEIIKLIALGLSNKQIADKLCLSLHTINTHRKNILQKLKVNNTAGVVMFAVKNNLLAEELHAN